MASDGFCAQSRLLFENCPIVRSPVELEMARASANLKIARYDDAPGIQILPAKHGPRPPLFVNLLRRLPGEVWIDLEAFCAWCMAWRRLSA